MALPRRLQQRSKYVPHQGEREKARRIRQGGVTTFGYTDKVYFRDMDEIDAFVEEVTARVAQTG